MARDIISTAHVFRSVGTSGHRVKIARYFVVVVVIRTYGELNYIVAFDKSLILLCRYASIVYS